MNLQRGAGCQPAGSAADWQSALWAILIFLAAVAILAGRPQAARADVQPESEKGQGVEKHDDYGVLFGPPPGADNAKWLAAMQQWREKRRAELAYDGSEYNRPELSWARRNFVQALMIAEERYCYDRAANKYTVDRYLDDLEAR